MVPFFSDSRPLNSFAYFYDLRFAFFSLCEAYPKPKSQACFKLAVSLRFACSCKPKFDRASKLTFLRKLAEFHLRCPNLACGPFGLRFACGLLAFGTLTSKPQANRKPKGPQAKQARGLLAMACILLACGLLAVCLRLASIGLACGFGRDKHTVWLR